MDDTPKPSHIFSNRVIRQLIDHSMGEDLKATDEDIKAIRMVFRWCGGNWEEFYHGNQLQQELLKQIVSAWGQMPNRVREDKD